LNPTLFDSLQPFCHMEYQKSTPVSRGAQEGIPMILSINGKHPRIGGGVFIAPTAVVIGDVTIAEGASIWYGAVLRGDMEPIRIGRRTNIQDNCTVHTDYGSPVSIGDGVSVGHNAVIHGCTIEDDCLISIAAVILNRAVVRRNSVVAAGAVVREGQTVGPNHLVAGTPAVLKRVLTADEMPPFLQPVANYRTLAAAHRTWVGEASDSCSSRKP
jgi:carbonic anhydrase/acetyltransferase-like protein (isoleucine patch superfamily)